MEIFFTSDHHFGHTNIIRHSQRPFKYTSEMDDYMIEQWNSVVKPGDKVYHLGDLSFHGIKKTDEILSILNGDIYYIRGNHDKRIQQHKWRFQWIKDLYEFKQDKISITLCHYGMRVWNKSFHGSYHLYGHSHSTLPHTKRSFDVGVDNWDFKPIILEYVMEIFKSWEKQEDDTNG